MKTPIVSPLTRREITRAGFSFLPPVILNSGQSAARRFVEFFIVTIRNRNTRLAYQQALLQFLIWCEERNIANLQQIQSIHVASYIEKHTKSAPTVKQHLAALRKLFDWLVTGQVIPFSPAASVRGPSHIVKRGKTPVLSAQQCRTLLESIETNSLIGLRDRALIGIMVHSFARVSATVQMQVCDYYRERDGWKFRLHEKGGHLHVVPAHPSARSYLDTYLKAAKLGADKTASIFRTIARNKSITDQTLTRTDVYKMIKRRAKKAGLPSSTCCHTFRGTGITVFRENGGSIERAQAIANHASPRTTKLYDRMDDKITETEIERIII